MENPYELTDEQRRERLAANQEYLSKRLINVLMEAQFLGIEFDIQRVPRNKEEPKMGDSIYSISTWGRRGVGY